MKLLVAGCSVSDRYNVKKTYGEYLFQQLQIDSYIHEAKNGGSNYRIWRKLVGHVLSGNLNPEDIIIIQYTEETRHEFWSPYLRNIEKRGYDNSENYLDDGTIVSFCIDGHLFDRNYKAESTFMKTQEKFLSLEFEHEKFMVNHNMFQTFMNYHGFQKMFFLNINQYAPEYNLIDEYKNNLIEGSHLLNMYPGNDKWHLSELGHLRTAELIFNFLKKGQYNK